MLSKNQTMGLGCTKSTLILPTRPLSEKMLLKLRKERNAPKKAHGVDYMTLGEIAAVTKRQSQIAVLLEMGLSYQTIKDIVAASTQKSALPSAANT